MKLVGKLSYRLFSFSNDRVKFLHCLPKTRHTTHFVHSTNPLKVQTFWSDFSYYAVFDSSSVYPFNKNEINYADLKDESDTVFQETSRFKNYGEMSNFQLDKRSISLGPSEFLSLRIPQESSLNVVSCSDVEIFNPMDTKLLADTFVVELKNSSETANKLNCNRLKAVECSLSCEGKALFYLKSFEVADLKVTSGEYLSYKGRKLGISERAKISGKLLDFDVRSVYSKSLKLTFAQAFIDVGSLNGHFEAKGNIGDIVIDSVERSDVTIEIEEGKIEMMIKGMEDNYINLVNKRGKSTLFVSLEVSDLVIKHEGQVVFKKGSKEEGVTVNVEGKNKPEVEEIESWEFMKRKIMRKFNKA